MEITKISEVELKAIAFDAMVNIEQLQTNLRSINQELTRRAKEKVVAPIPKENENAEK